MTGRERFIQLIKHKQPADRVGLYEHFWPETVRDYWVQQGYPSVDVPVGQYFKYDMVHMWPVSDPGVFKGEDGLVSETEETKDFRNGFGALSRYWKNKSGTPAHLDFMIKDRPGWDAVRDRLLSFDASRTNVDGAKEMLATARDEGRYSAYGFCFVFEVLRATIGDVLMLESLLLEPDWIKDFCRVYTDFYKEHFAYVLREAGTPDAVFMYEDLGFTNGLFCSPKVLRELILPYYKEILSMFKDDYGLNVLVHSCGDIREAVPIFIEAGVDCLQPMEAKAGVDVLDLADTYGNQLAYMGNINAQILGTNDKDKVRAEVERKMCGMIERRMPYILHSDHSVPPNVDFETYNFMMQIYKEKGAY